jgi:hypothetical protein
MMSVVVIVTQVGAEVSLEAVESVEEVRNRRDACVSVACVRRSHRRSEREKPSEQVRE